MSRPLRSRRLPPRTPPLSLRPQLLFPRTTPLWLVCDYALAGPHVLVEDQQLTALRNTTETEAAKAVTETPAEDTTATPAKEEAKEEAKKEAEPVEDGQLEHKGSNFPKYATPTVEATRPLHGHAR